MHPKPTPRGRSRTAAALLTAAALIGSTIALMPSLEGGRASTQIRQDADTASANSVVTTTMGPIAGNSVPLYTGPGYAYPTATFAQPFMTYAVTCFSAASVGPGTAGPYDISDMTTVWYLLADQTASRRTIGYILATDPANQFSIANTSIPDQVGRCASDPPPPVPPSSSTGKSVSAQTPQACARGILPQGLSTITVHVPGSQLDVEFTSAIPVPQDVAVQDETTGQSAEGYALTDRGATYHFTENQNSEFGDHTLSIDVEGALGGSSGDTVDGDVSWEVVSGGCIA